MDILISVIIPVYNAEKYLKECLDSVINQTYTNLQIVLVNDGSTDGSLSICKKYKEMDSRIVLFSQENGGVASARNTGLQNAKGEFIAWLDSDDTIEASYIENLYKGSKENGWLPVIAINKGLPKKGYGIIYRRDIVLYFLKGEIPSNMWSTLFQRSLYVGFEFKNYPIGEDSMMLLDIFTRTERILCIPVKGYMYRDNPSSISRKFDAKIICQQMDEINEQKKFVSEKFPYAVNAMNYKAAMFALGVLNKFGDKNVRRKAKQITKKSLAHVNLFKLSLHEKKELFLSLLRSHTGKGNL